MAGIKTLVGEDLGVFKNENYILVEWTGCQKIVFSFCQQGRAIVMHFATTKKGIRYLRQATQDFIDWAVLSMPWCRMIMAIIDKPSVVRLAMSFGFVPFHEQEGKRAFLKQI